MTTLPAFPKPGQVKKSRPAVRVYPSGREVCDLNTKAGQEEYSRRKKVMFLRQNKRCSLHFAGCAGKMSFRMATFEHDEGRGMGGSRRDDRIEIDGKPVNSVACPWCNSKKGSIRKSQLDEIAP